MKSHVVIDTSLIAACGLYCASCGKYRNGKCPGCAGNEKATWCKVRSCCMEKGIANCSECIEFTNVKECKKFNNFFAKTIEFLFRSDRAHSIANIREFGTDRYAAAMTEKEWMSFPKKKKR